MLKLAKLLAVIAFIGSVDQRLTIKRQFPEAMAVEMEATAIAQTCHQFHVPFIVTRAVSDLANGKQTYLLKSSLVKPQNLQVQLLNH